MTEYSVIVNLDNETLAALNNGWQMQVFKGVQTANAKGALPTVWFDVNEFSSKVKISWTESYGGYFDRTSINEGVTVDASTQCPMNAGDVITLAADGSASTSTIGGMPNAFTFTSKKPETWASGLMVAPVGKPLAPTCAFPQYGTGTNILKPLENILVLFTQQPLNTGAVVKTAVTTSVSITLSTSDTSAEVDFDINTGWDTKGKSNIIINEPNYNLAPSLVQFSPELANMLKDEALAATN